jgi:hypothetical protein
MVIENAYKISIANWKDIEHSKELGVSVCYFTVRSESRGAQTKRDEIDVHERLFTGEHL